MITKGDKARGLLDIIKIFIAVHPNNSKCEKSIQQKILEKLAEILQIQSCILFRIFAKQPERKTYCKITAGVPITEHKIGLEEELQKHPDIEDAIKNKERFMRITNPAQDWRCYYFKGIIENKKITEILYAPLLAEVSGEKIIKGVIAIDRTIDDGRKFNEEEIEFCCQVAELLTIIITREKIIIDEIRDSILNRIVSVGGLSDRLRKLINKILTDGEELKSVLEEVKMLETFFCEKNIIL
jgi:hypothetical protein